MEVGNKELSFLLLRYSYVKGLAVSSMLRVSVLRSTMYVIDCDILVFEVLREVSISFLIQSRVFAR